MLTTTEARALPSIRAIDAADERIGTFLSDLDDFRHRVAILCGENVSIEDASFMLKTGIEIDPEPAHVDPAVLARLLVLVDDVLVNDLETIKRDAEDIRTNLLSLYRENVIEPSGRSRARAQLARITERRADA
jgi:hypothetical protein